MDRPIEEYRRLAGSGTTEPLPEYAEGTPERMAAENDGLVFGVLWRVFRRADDDLLQAGRSGLLTACHRYDPGRGIALSTYAEFYIREWVRRAVAAEHVVSTPKYLATADPAGKHDKKRAIAAKAKVVRSLDITDRTRRRPRRDQIADPAPGSSVEDAMRAEDAAAVAAAIREMGRTCPRLADILRWRYGVGGISPLTLAAVGKRLGLSKERTRQLEARALEVLRGHLAPRLEMAS